MSHMLGSYRINLRQRLRVVHQDDEEHRFLVAGARAHRELRVFDEARVGVGARTSEEDGPAPVGPGAFPAASKAETDFLVRHGAPTLDGSNPR
jgi:hypothetical protein